MTPVGSRPGVVVVGGGHAGVQAADSARAADPDVPITVLSAETGLPYQRPPLSKTLLDEDDTACHLPLRAATFFIDRRIELLCGTRVTRIDPVRRTVHLEGAVPVPYASLVLATGARARRLAVPGHDLAGTHELRTLTDAGRLRDALRAGRSVVIIGGGFIGLELASTAAAHGHRVTVVELADRILARALTPESATWLTDFHRAAGVDIRLGTDVAVIEGKHGRVCGVRTTNGDQLAADVVVVGVGAVPECDLARDAGLQVDDGVVVDAALRSSDPHILAVGDCARFPDVRTGRPTRLESVQNATDQSRCAGANAVALLSGGSLTDYAAVPWFWSHQGTVRLQIAGVGGLGDMQTTLRRYSDTKFSVLGFEGGRLAVVESVNAPGDHMAARALLTRQTDVDPGAVTDPSVPLKSLLDVA